jgi:hypothetical protein
VGSEVQILPGPPNRILCGGVAQLGEHLLCKQGVIGSIPIVSTIFSVITMAPSWLPQWRGVGGMINGGLAGLILYRGMFEFGTTERPGQSVPGVLFVPSMRLPVAALLFFVSVNQVLVRLWTRATNVVPTFVALLICG